MKKFWLGIVALVMGVSLSGVLMAPTMAKGKSCVETAIMGETKCTKNKNGDLEEDKDNGKINCSCDNGEGSGVKSVLSLVAEIMTIGVGILGVLGITIVGVQYLTAGGNEEQTRKAKRRMFEIVVGIAVYVVIYALLKWLIKDFEPF